MNNKINKVKGIFIDYCNQQVTAIKLQFQYFIPKNLNFFPDFK
jgi:hypothetical protein